MIELNIPINKKSIRHFMQDCGSIIDWDLSVGNHDFSYNNVNMNNNNLSEKSKRVLKTKTYKAICECIFLNTKNINKTK